MKLPKNRIAELREARGLLRVDLAAHCGVSEATICRWELGVSAIADEHKFRLAELLGVTISELMGWDQVEAAA